MNLTIKRTAVSAFLLAHLTAVVAWNLPACALRERLTGFAFYYMMGTGQWQAWGMFAPEPSKASAQLEAVVRDRHGLNHHFTFPRLADRSVGEGFWLYRHAKYGSVLADPDAKAHREFGARYVLRKLDLKEDDYPVDLELFYQVSETLPPGSPEGASPPLPYPQSLERYHFPTLAETRP